MKKIKIIIIVSALLLLLAGCNEHRETDLSYENVNIESSKEFEFTNIDEVVEMAEFIVIVKLLMKKNFQKEVLNIPLR